MLSEFEERTLVNGGMLRKFLGEMVSIMLRVKEEIGSTLVTLSTDGQEIRVRLPNNEPLDARKGYWVQVIGVPSENSSVNAREVILFRGEDIDFDENAYNMMVQFVNNCKEVFRSG